MFCTQYQIQITVRTLIAKKFSIRMFSKSEFTPAHQITAFYLEKQKSWRIGVKCALCSGVRSDLSTWLKQPRKDKLMLSYLNAESFIKVA